MRYIFLLFLQIGVSFSCTFDASCMLEYSDMQQHCVESQCMSYIREPCEDGNLCYNNLAKTSFGMTCDEKICKVNTGGRCNHDADCTSETDKCNDQICMSTTCDCEHYQDCINYQCVAKSCSLTKNCNTSDSSNNVLGAFCYQNLCRPLASFGGACGISDDCGEPNASCVDGVCVAKSQSVGLEQKNEGSFTSGFLVGCLFSGIIGAVVYMEVKSGLVSQLMQKMKDRVGYGEIPIAGEVVDSQNEVIHVKQVQLSYIT